MHDYYESIYKIEVVDLCVFMYSSINELDCDKMCDCVLNEVQHMYIEYLYSDTLKHYSFLLLQIGIYAWVCVSVQLLFFIYIR